MIARIRGRRVGQPLADWVDGCIAPSLRRFGFGEVDIVTAWADIAGARVASFAEPVRIKWPRVTGAARAASAGADRAAAPADARPPATLVVRVDGAFALELQHVAPLLIDRINAHLGWRCIGKIAMLQAPLVGRIPSRPERSALAPRAVAAARDLTAGIDDDGLRQALVRLGARVLDVP